MKDPYPLSTSFSGPGRPLAIPDRSLPRPLAQQLLAARPRTLASAVGTASELASAIAVAARARPVSAEHRLLHRATMGVSRTDLEQIDRLGYERYLEWQLAYEEHDDTFLEQAIAENLPSVGMSPFELITSYGMDRAQPVFELLYAVVFRAIFSQSQLYQRMWTFWTDHFNIDVTAGLQNFLKPVDDREVIRPHVLGKFPDMLSASAHSPAMLIYLTNDSNVKGHPNENYARELMELHTMGADNGYTQEDVREVARCFTGWTVWGERGGRSGVGRFRFNAQAHDIGSKRVLGQQIPAGGGVEDGEEVLRILANHPNTAHFVAEKMMRYLWGYEPPSWMVQRVADTYLETGGDIRAMVRLILNPNWIRKAPAKLKRPFHLVISTQRALFSEVAQPRFLLGSLYSTGQLPFFWHPPNGYPDSAEYWSGLLLPRWNFADLAPKVELEGLQEGISELARIGNPGTIVDRIDWLLFDFTLPPRERRALADFLAAGEITPERVLDALGLALAGAQFQLY